jgi:predicted nucleic acid-binding protein
MVSRVKRDTINFNGKIVGILLSRHANGQSKSQEILVWFEVVQVEAGKIYVKTDPSNDKFIWCALSGKAEAIISGDEHLLRLRSSPVPILSAQEFLKRDK